MDDALIIIMMLFGVLALYWLLFGQWKYNKQMGYSSNESLAEVRAKLEKYEADKESKKKDGAKKK